MPGEILAPLAARALMSVAQSAHPAERRQPSANARCLWQKLLRSRPVRPSTQAAQSVSPAMISPASSGDTLIGVLNPLVDYSADFVGDFDPNLLAREDVEAVLQSGADIRDPNAIKEVLDSAKPQRRGRFGNAMSLDQALELNESTKPKSTVRRDNWAANVFRSWIEGRFPEKPSNAALLSDMDLKHLLPIFFHEVRREDGARYPAGSLVSLAAGLQRNASKERSVDFFKGDSFKVVTESIDAAMKISTKNGAGLQRRSAEVISIEEESRIWETELGEETPERLQQSLFYLNGLHFALRGRDEHAELTMDQFRLEKRDGVECLVYTEKKSKTFTGGLKQRRLTPKEVVQFPNEEIPDRCHVRLFKKFTAVRPNGTDRFYLLPLKKPGTTWFTVRPLGKNTLGTLMKRMCENAGIQGNKRNHSLRATCATRLYRAGVDEQLIMEKTGHRSVVGVRQYKRTGDVQLRQCSAVIDGRSVANAAAEQKSKDSGASVAFHFVNCSVVINNGV